MPTLLCSFKVEPNYVTRWEEVINCLVRESSQEPGLLKYEYYRGAGENAYYVFLAFTDTDSFYEHQGAEYHEKYFGEASNFISDLTFEWLDPVPAGGSGLPPTRGEPISATASDRAKAQVAEYPIEVQEWWQVVAG